MNWFDDSALSLAVFIPLVGMALVLVIPKAQEQAIKLTTLITAVVTLGVGIGILAEFDYGTTAQLFSTRIEAEQSPPRRHRRQPAGFGRFARAAEAIGSGDCELLRDALDDRLNEPYRAPLVPLLEAVRGRVRDRDEVYGATISGAGPTVLVWCEPGAEDGVLALLSPLDGAAPLAVAAAHRGATIL